MDQITPTTPEQQIPATTTSVEQPTQPTLKKTPLWKKILLIGTIVSLIVAAMAGIGAYFLAKQLLPSTDSTNITDSQNAAKILNNPVVKKMIQSAPIPKVTMIPITITITPPATSNTPASQVASWKTYQNPTYRFSLNYPGNETYQENNHGLGVIDIVFFDTTQGSSTDTPDYQLLLFPKSIGSLIGQDFDTLYNLPNPSAQILKINNTSQQFTKLQNTTINGLRAFTFQSTSYPPVANEQAQVGEYIEVGDNILTVSTGQNNQSILNSMVSSFKYTP